MSVVCKTICHSAQIRVTSSLLKMLWEHWAMAPGENINLFPVVTYCAANV